MIFKNTFSSCWKLSLLLVITGLFMPGVIPAEDVEVLTITPPSEIKEIKKIKTPSSTTKRKVSNYDGMGHINRIEQNEIVIDDTIYSFSSSVKYRNKRNRKVSRSRFKVNSYVGFKITVSGSEDSQKGSDGSAEITELWLLK